MEHQFPLFQQTKCALTPMSIQCILDLNGGAHDAFSELVSCKNALQNWTCKRTLTETIPLLIKTNQNWLTLKTWKLFQWKFYKTSASPLNPQNTKLECLSLTERFSLEPTQEGHLRLPQFKGMLFTLPHNIRLG